MTTTIRTAIFTLLLFGFTFFGYSQLNDTADFLKHVRTELYEPLRDRALDRHSDDDVIVFEINEQAEALWFFLTEKTGYDEMVKSIRMWSDDEDAFIKAEQDWDTEVRLSLKENRDPNPEFYRKLFRMRTDWVMAKMTYDTILEKGY